MDNCRRDGGMERAKEIYYRLEHQDYMLKHRGLERSHMQKLTSKMKELIGQSTEKNPFIMMINILERLEGWETDAAVPVHGEWHHFLVPGVILASLRNSGYPVSEEDLAEGIQRGDMAKVSCGFTGVCGGANSVGIVASMINKATPLHSEERQRLMRLTAGVLQKIAEIPGRCCKRSSYIALEKALAYLSGAGLPLETSDIKCPFSSRNNNCAREKCPYYKSI